MTTHTYQDFDLEIDQLDSRTYRARVLNSPAGQGEADFELPFTEQELEIFFLRVGRPRRGVRSLNSPEMSEAREFGRKLYQAVFHDDVQACLLRSLAKSDEQGLRIRLRLPPALMDLPWEYLYDASFERFFSHSTNTPIIRYLDLGQPIRPLAVTPPLNVLVMIASPRDYEQLDVEAEWRKIESATAGLLVRGLIQLTRLPAATLSALQRQLRQDQYHIFHFIGHGGFDQQTQDGVLLLEDESGRSRLVNGNYLGTLLHDHPSLRLAVLNACEGARTTRSDPFAGVAQQLVRQGIPAVIAMQFEITDQVAIILAREFYDALADGYPVDAALAEARKSIYTAGNDIEWGTPVLYMRAEDGRLFDVAALPHAVEPTPVPTTPVERAKLTRQKRAVRRQAGFVAAMLAILIVALGFWQRRMTGGWLGWGSAPATSTLTAPETHTAIGVPTQTPKPTLTFATGPTREVTLAPGVETVFVYVPAGRFLMGSLVEGSEDEHPQHEVTLDAFWIMRTEVTNIQYKQCADPGWCGEPQNDRWRDSDYSQHPVTDVDWLQANDFANWVSRKLPVDWGRGRLPTEAEWEMAARGIDSRKYPWGNAEPDEQLLNFAFSIDDTSEVGSYTNGASPFGVLDMAGNVWEWVADWYDEGYYAKSPERNPQGPAKGKYRVVRGGAFNGMTAYYERSAIRDKYDPDGSYYNLGFRVASSGP